MRTLVLGARGMLGHALVAAFGDDVVGWDREELDITDAAAVRTRLGEASPAVVINAAAFTDVDAAESNPEVVERVNGEAVGHVAVACRALGAPLLHISTDYVFDGESFDGYAEDAVPQNPVNAYGRSKLRGEALLQESGADAWLVRTSWLFGPHGKNFVATMLDLGATRPEVRVVDDQHGAPTYTMDLAEAVRALILDRAPYGIYHLPNDGLTSWAEIAQETFAAAGMTTRVMPISSAELQRSAKRPRWSILRNTKRPRLRDWRAAVRAYVQTLRPS